MMYIFMPSSLQIIFRIIQYLKMVLNIMLIL